MLRPCTYIDIVYRNDASSAIVLLPLNDMGFALDRRVYREDGRPLSVTEVGDQVIADGIPSVVVAVQLIEPV
jgi:hypothetical protein